MQTSRGAFIVPHEQLVPRRDTRGVLQGRYPVDRSVYGSFVHKPAFFFEDWCGPFSRFTGAKVWFKQALFVMSQF